MLQVNLSIANWSFVTLSSYWSYPAESNNTVNHLHPNYLASHSAKCPKLSSHPFFSQILGWFFCTVLTEALLQSLHAKATWKFYSPVLIHTPEKEHLLKPNVPSLKTLSFVNGLNKGSNCSYYRKQTWYL